jgi:hypothetical protein
MSQTAALWGYDHITVSGASIGVSHGKSSFSGRIYAWFEGF